MSYTLYDILEVSSRASPAMIRTAYRTLAGQYHPDRNPGRGSAELMAEINRAYAILSDPLKRKGYDATLVPSDLDSSPAPSYASAREPAAQSAHERSGSADATTDEREQADAQPGDAAAGWQWNSEPIAEPVVASTRKQWLFVLLLLSFGSLIAGTFSRALDNIQVSDRKEIQIAGQWKRYNELSPSQTADAYFTGQGAPLNYGKARELYGRIVAESRARKSPAGLIDERGRLALRRLGEMYAKGLGVDRDWTQARAFYEEAARSGDIPSMAALADSLAADNAPHSDLIAAYAWYNRLAAVIPGTYAFSTANDTETYRMLAEAARKRDALQKKLTADELSRAQAL